MPLEERKVTAAIVPVSRTIHYPHDSFTLTRPRLAPTQDQLAINRLFLSKSSLRTIISKVC